MDISHLGVSSTTRELWARRTHRIQQDCAGTLRDQGPQREKHSGVLGRSARVSGWLSHSFCRVPATSFSRTPHANPPFVTRDSTGLKVDSRRQTAGKVSALHMAKLASILAPHFFSNHLQEWSLRTEPAVSLNISWLGQPWLKPQLNPTDILHQVPNITQWV